MIHDAIRKLYADACTINGDTKDAITVWNKNGKYLLIGTKCRQKQLSCKLHLKQKKKIKKQKKHQP